MPGGRCGLLPSLEEQREKPESKKALDQIHWLGQIKAERDRQDAKWGFPQENTYCEWASILTEEVGELAKELNELNFGRGNIERMIEEAVQVAAVALAIIEQRKTARAVSEKWAELRVIHVEQCEKPEETKVEI